MKVLLTTVSLLICGVVSEGPAPYAPSGWRPSGPSFELPQRAPSEAQNPQTNYLPPGQALDPRNRTPLKQQDYLPPQPSVPGQTYGTPDVDLSVQGLPQQEQVPIFQISPINGQQYVGPDFSADIRNLDKVFKEIQAQNQQEIYRQFARQRQLEAAQSKNNPNGFQSPRQFASRTTISPTQVTFTTATPEERTTTETTTEISLNEGESLDDNTPKKEKVSVEVAKQNIQAFPPELLLSPLAQFRLQPQLVPLQFEQYRAPLVYPGQESEKQVSGYDAQLHFAALPSVLAQQQLAQSPAAVPLQPQYVPQTQIAQGQNPVYLASRGQEQGFVQVGQQPYQPAVNHDQSQVQTFPQFQGQTFIPQGQVQTNSQPEQKDVTQQQPLPQQPQFVYQYQPEYQQPYPMQPQVYQPQAYQPQEQLILPNQYYQQQILQQQAQQQNQGQNNLQSGYDVNQQGNNIDQTEDREYDADGMTATAVATAFGARTQPRVYMAYGAPQTVPVPRVQSNPGYQTTTEAQDEAVTEDGQAIEAISVARGSRRKSAKLRNRRVRPVFTLDNSGHLVLAQDQE